MDTKEINEIFLQLEKEHQPTMLELLKDYNPLQLLIATMLSSRTKDTTTIPIVRKIFEKNNSPEDFLSIPLIKLEKMLYGIGFYKVKAKNIHQLSTIILEKYSGNIPDNFEELTSLPGVGRKTANCILNYVFKQPCIAVDIHVHRISNRLGWVKTKRPEETEEALKVFLPKDKWMKVNSLLINHGQRICLPIKPKCSHCSISNYCPSKML